MNRFTLERLQIVVRHSLRIVRSVKFKSIYSPSRASYRARHCTVRTEGNKAAMEQSNEDPHNGIFHGNHPLNLDAYDHGFQ